MSPRNPMAQALLDAQVEWVLDEITGSAATESLAGHVADLLHAAADLPLAELVDRDELTRSGRILFAAGGASDLVADLAIAIPAALRTARVARRHALGDVVDREHVEALLTTVFGLREAPDKVGALLAESPLIGALATSFLSRLVGDVIAQNRERAERVPGVSSLLSLGTSAASKMRSVAERPVEALLGEASGRGGDYALRRTAAAIRELAETGAVGDALIEVWDIQASRPVADLFAFATGRELRAVAADLHRMLAAASTTEYAGAVVDTCVEVFFDRFGGHPVGALIEACGLSIEETSAMVGEHLAEVLRGLRESGALHDWVSARLAPFYDSARVTGILSGGSATTPRSRVNSSR